MNVEIKNRYTGNVMHSAEAETLKDALEMLVRQGADMRGADLTDANLTGAYLTDAYLTRANLRGANLTGAYLRGAYLRDANLRGAYLTGAYLAGADLTDAYLRGAYLTDAYLRGAYLRDANLTDAYLTDADMPDYQICPSEGEFIAYKKVEGNVVLTLRIPAEAKRTSCLISRKCRASAAIPIRATRDGVEIPFPTEGFPSMRCPVFYYQKNVTVTCREEFNSDIRIECASGIHFFITQAEAERWGL